MKRPDTSTQTLAMAGLFAAMITIMTAYIFHIPYGANGGYIHFGDALIFLAAVFLPRPYAIAAAGIGGGLADLMTAPAWAPFTIVIKMLMAAVFSNQKEKIVSGRNLGAAVAAAIINIVGYYIAEGVLYGSFAAALLSIWGNVVQGLGSFLIFFLLGNAFDKAGLRGRLAKRV